MRTRRTLLLLAVAGSVVLTPGTALAADRPLLGTADLVNTAPLPRVTTLPQYRDGGFSGLFPVAGTSDEYWTISDRGPNLDPLTGTIKRPFPAPGFAPTIYRVEVDLASKRMSIVQRIPLRLPAGAADAARANDLVGGDPRLITGFGNFPATPAANVVVPDEVPISDTDGDGEMDAADPVLPYDPYGLDTEGIAVDSRDGSFWTVDEYRPSIIHVAADGTLLQRYTPAGQSNANLPGHDAVPLKDVLPAIFSSRRDNRGFEGVAISPDGRSLYAVVQNPLAQACSGNDPFSTGVAYQAAAARTATRLVKVDISDPAAPVLAKDVVYTLDNNGGTLVNPQQRISDLYWVGPDQVLVDERDDTDGTAAQGEPSTTFKKLYRADLSSATDLRTLPADRTTCLDAARPAGIAARGITPVTKALVLDAGSASASAEYPISKLEGVVQRADGSIVVVNDNDFATTSPDRPTRFSAYGTSAPAPVVPEAPVAALLPVLGLLGAGLLVRRRRVRA